MNSNRTCMNQNMSAARNMRGGYPGTAPMRSPQNDCGCAGSGTMPQNAARQVSGDCGCAGSGMMPQNAAHQVSNDCGCAGPGTMSQNAARQVSNDCGCTADIPAGDRLCLRSYINEVSFAAYEAALYLDTHPDCQNALQYFQEHNEKRSLALAQYGKLYGPMTLAQACESCSACWQWVNQPWPWEGGNC